MMDNDTVRSDIWESLIAITKRFEKIIYGILIALFLIIIAVSVFELGWLIIASLIADPPGTGGSYLLENREILNIFGFFLLVLIGIELLGTMRAYLRDNIIHVEVVVILAIIAVARKVIVIEPDTTTTLALVGEAILILALCVGYYLIRKAGVNT